MSESFDIVFQGNGESECIEFIQAVQKHAKKNKKMRDNKWIADEVYGTFGGQALGWYVRLPVNVREDWELLQQALATRWIPEVDGNPGENVSSPAVPPGAAAAPLVTYPPQPTSSGTSTPNGKVGRIRIRMPGISNQDVRYLSKDTRKIGYENMLGALDTAENVALAVKVRLVMVEPNFHRLELVDHESGFSVLAAFLFRNFEWDSTDTTGVLLGVDAPAQDTLMYRRSTFAGDEFRKYGKCWTDKWQLGDTGVLTLYGPRDTETARFGLTEDDRDKDVLIFIGPKAYWAWSAQPRVLEFEPVDC